MVVGAATVSFATLVDVVGHMAQAAGSPVERLGAAVGVLVRAVDASAGLLLQGSHEATQVPAFGGGERVTTASRTLGPDLWQASTGRRAILRSWGVDQLLTLPVHRGAGTVVVVLGRLGEDFTDEQVALLETLRPTLSALATILEPELLPDPRARVLRLTRREGTILALLAHGHTAVRIAHLAGCSPRTVHHHLANIYAKLGVRDRLSAVNRARELGLVQPEPLLVVDEAR